MARTTLGAAADAKSSLYVFLYGPSGAGKTTLGYSLSKQNGLDVLLITPEPGASLALTRLKFDRNSPIEQVPARTDMDPFEVYFKALNEAARDPAIKTVIADGLTTLSGRAIEHYSDGEGERALGFQGWGQILTQFRRLEKHLTALAQKDKNIVLTAWDAAPEYEANPFDPKDRVLVEKGRPLIQGKAKQWMPGLCDMVFRVEGSMGFRDGKQQWLPKLHLYESDTHIAKCPWQLKSPFQGNLRELQAAGMATDVARPAPKPVVAPMKPKLVAAAPNKVPAPMARKA